MTGSRFTLLLLLLSACATAKPAPERSSLVGKPLRLSVPDLNGRTYELGGPKGKVRIVDFWATWCEPCKKSMPFFNATQRELGRKGVSVYAVNVNDDLSAIADFKKTIPLQVAVLRYQGNNMEEEIGVSDLPTTFIVDKKGVIRYVHRGFDASIAREEREQVVQLLSE